METIVAIALLVWVCIYAHGLALRLAPTNVHPDVATHDDSVVTSHDYAHPGE